MTSTTDNVDEALSRWRTSLLGDLEGWSPLRDTLFPQTLSDTGDASSAPGYVNGSIVKEGKVYVSYPKEDSEFFRYPICNLSNISRAFTKAVELSKHFYEAHKSSGLEFTCTRCKNFDKVHAVECHLPKCKGPKSAPIGSFVCTGCQRSFTTSRGISTHERKCMPKVRNEQRVAGTLQIPIIEVNDGIVPLTPTTPDQEVVRRAWGQTWSPAEVLKNLPETARYSVPHTQM